MARTKIPIVVLTDTRTSFRPGLNSNAKTEAVFDAIDRLRQALKECQETPHIKEWPND